MNARDVAYGYGIGFNDGINAGGGGGGSGYVNNDPDYALYKALPEPADNQAVIFMRIADCTEKTYIDAYDISGENNCTVDWGDGTSEIPEQTGSSHSYAAPGDYIITVTDNSAGKITTVSCRMYRNFGYPIAMKVGSEFPYSDLTSGKIINYSSNFKYIQFACDIWESGYIFQSSNRLTRIDILSGAKPDKLVNYQFNSCYALDFENLLPLFSEVTEVGNSVFNSCYNLKKLSLPKCTKVGNNSIYQCYSLTHVDMPLCTEIGSDSIYSDYALREANLPLCASVGNYGLAYNYSLNKVVLSDSCSFGSNSLNNCYCLIPTPNNIYPY